MGVGGLLWMVFFFNTWQGQGIQDCAFFFSFTIYLSIWHTHTHTVESRTNFWRKRLDNAKRIFILFFFLNDLYRIYKSISVNWIHNRYNDRLPTVFCRRQACDFPPLTKGRH